MKLSAEQPDAGRSASPMQRETESSPSCGAARRRRLFLASILASAWLFYHGYQRRPCGADAGTSLSGDAPATASSGASFRVGTFNIHGGVGRTGMRDLSRTAETLAGLDLAALNEVHGGGLWESEGQAEVLGRRLQRRWLFAPTEDRWWGRRFGNAALSSLTVTSWQTVPLRQRESHSCRNAVLLTARQGGRDVHIVVTHLDRADDERSHQLRAVADLFLASAEPALLLGDLNCTQADPELQQLRSRPGVHDPLAEILGDRTPPHIDWILTRGLHTIDAGLIDHGASDHPLIWAEIEVPR